MATSINQGYIRSLNLEETLDETLAINTLMGGNIANDLKIFSNNTRNISNLVYKFGESNFSINETGSDQTTQFEFNSISTFGNGDRVKIFTAKTISTVDYQLATSTQPERLLITFDSPHSLTASAVGKTIKLYDTYFSNGTTFFNNKNFKIISITSTQIVVINLGWDTLYDVSTADGQPGTFQTTDASNNTLYPHVISTSADLFPLPSYTLADDPGTTIDLVHDKFYTVVLSDGVNKFKIASTFNRGEQINAFKFNAITDSIVFQRSNEVTKDNLLNLTYPKFVDYPDDDNEGKIFSNNVLDKTIQSNFSAIENEIDTSNYFRYKKFTQSLDNIFDVNELRIEGYYSSFDPDNFNNSSSAIYDEHSPGLYILDPDSTFDNVVKVRSFSENTSPWELIGSTLEYSATSLSNPSGEQGMSIGNLILQDNDADNAIYLDGIQNVTTLSPSENLSAASFTHKLPVLVNGEQYYFLLDEVV